MIAERELKSKTSTRTAIVASIVTLLALFGGIGSWMALADISGAIVSSGTVAVMGRPKTIQHLDGGIIADIKVTDGDRVQRHDLLILLDDTTLKANIAIYTKRLEEGLAERSRLEAERDGKSAIVWDDVDDISAGVRPSENIRASQTKLLTARRESREGQRARLLEKVEQFGNQIDGVKGLQASKKEQIKFIDQELSGLRSLQKDGNTTINRLLSLERQRADLLGQLAEHGAELSRIENSISEAQISILQLDREFLETVLSELRKRDQDVNDMVQQLIATRAQLSRVEVRSPVSGIIHQMSMFTIGGVVAPGASILQIVPADDNVEVEVQIGTQFVDEVHVGQPARVRFTAFNQRTTPELTAAVATISPSSVIDERAGTSHYRVWLRLTPEELAKLNGQTLVPGMPAEVFIKTRDRTALSYLVKPLADQINRAFREE